MNQNLREKVAIPQESGWNYGYRKSAFFHVSLQNQASYTVYNGRLLPVNQGEDRIEGYWALRKSVAFFDTGERPLEILGPDAERFCDRLFTKDIRKLRPGRATYGLLCYPNGKLLCDGILMRLAEDRFWYVQTNGEAFTWFMAHAFSMDVAIIDPNSTVVQIQGPKALEVLARASDNGVPDSFGYFAVAEITMGGQPVIVSRTGYTAELGFAIYTFDDDLDAYKLWSHLAEAGEPFDMAVCGLDSMDARRIEAGLLNYGSDMDHTLDPYQAGLGAFVDLTKKDFVGKESLKLADRENLLYGLQSDKGELTVGSALRNGTGKKIGMVTASSWSPYLQKGVSIVRLYDPSYATASNTTALCIKGRNIAATICKLPFYDEIKQIPRGICAAKFD